MKKLFFFACLMMTAFLLQAAPVFADCSNTVSPTSMTIGATTRAAKFNVQASSKYDCSWSFQIPDQPCSWLRTSASCDISTEEKSFLIITDANTDRQSRTCSFQVCEQTITVIQEGEASQNTVYLPHITGGENDWKDLLEVDNTYSSALEYTITLYDADGNQIYNQTRSIAALSYQSLELKELAVNASSGMISYVAASSDLLFRVGYENLSGGGVADFVLAADAYTDTAFAFPNFSATVEWKGAAMMNTGESAATVTLEAFNAAGEKLGATDITIPAKAKRSGTTGTWFPELSASSVARIEASATGNITGIAISGDNSGSKLLFTQGMTMDTTYDLKILPHITGGEADWTDYLEVDNTANTPGKFTIKLYDKDGKIAYEDGFFQSHEVPAKGYIAIKLKDLAANAVCGLVSGGPSQLRFRLAYENVNGGMAEFMVPVKADDSVNFLFANDSAMVAWKGLAVMNTADQGAEVTFKAYGSGQELASSTVSIASKSRYSNVLGSLFPGLEETQIERVQTQTGDNQLTGLSISGDSGNTKLLFAPAVP